MTSFFVLKQQISTFAQRLLAHRPCAAICNSLDFFFVCTHEYLGLQAWQQHTSAPIPVVTFCTMNLYMISSARLAMLTGQKHNVSRYALMLCRLQRPHCFRALGSNHTCARPEAYKYRANLLHLAQWLGHLACNTLDNLLYNKQAKCLNCVHWYADGCPFWQKAL